jgi:hypothetical protein
VDFHQPIRFFVVFDQPISGFSWFFTSQSDFFHGLSSANRIFSMVFDQPIRFFRRF